MGTNPYSEQRLLIAHALDAIGDAHFALAGSGAIREHGLITRGTQDVDLFTVAEAIDRFPRAVSTLVDHLSNRGYHVMIRRQNPTFSELAVTTPAGTDLQVDLGIDLASPRPRAPRDRTRSRPRGRCRQQTRSPLLTGILARLS